MWVVAVSAAGICCFIMQGDDSKVSIIFQKCTRVHYGQLTLLAPFFIGRSYEFSDLSESARRLILDYFSPQLHFWKDPKTPHYYAALARAPLWVLAVALAIIRESTGTLPVPRISEIFEIPEKAASIIMGVLIVFKCGAWDATGPLTSCHTLLMLCSPC